MAARTRVMFDGHDITNSYIVTDLVRPWASQDLSTIDIPGSDGTTVLSRRLTGCSVSMTIHAAGALDTRISSLHTLMGWLTVKEPKWLLFSDEVGDNGSSCLRRRAIPTSVTHGKGHVNSDSVEVVFLLPDPFAEKGSNPWGTGTWSNESTKSGTPPFTSNVTVGGTYPAAFTIESSANLALKTWNTVKSGTWNDLKATGTTWQTYGGGGQTVRFDIAGTRLQADITGYITTAAKVHIDTDARTFRIGTVEVPITLDSDWPVIEPGTVAIKSYDIPSYKLSVNERWL